MVKIRKAAICAVGTVKIAGACIVFLLHALTVHAQVTLSLPPSYTGSGDLFNADFNRDGKIDLLSSDGTLELGNGDGTFTLGTAVPGGVLAIGDFNGDGNTDVLQQGIAPTRRSTRPVSLTWTSPGTEFHRCGQGRTRSVGD